MLCAVRSLSPDTLRLLGLGFASVSSVYTDSTHIALLRIVRYLCPVRYSLRDLRNRVTIAIGIELAIGNTHVEPLGVAIGIVHSQPNNHGIGDSVIVAN